MRVYPEIISVKISVLQINKFLNQLLLKFGLTINLRSVSNLKAEAWLRADATGVAHPEPDVAVLAPPDSPRVLQSPVVLRIADQQDVVVDLAAAVLEDAGLVELPVVGVDGHGEGAHVQLVLQLRAAICNYNTLGELEVGAGILAGLLDSGIWVLSSGGDANILQELDGPRPAPALAAEGSVVGGAVDDLLLGQVGGGPGADEVEALQQAIGAEGVPGIALALVLHRCYLALLLPVHVIGGVDVPGRRRGHDLDLLDKLGLVGEHALELQRAEVSESIDAHLVALVQLRVVLDHLPLVLSEDQLAVDVDFLAEFLSELLLPLQPAVRL